MNPRSGKETGKRVMIKFFDDTTGDSFAREVKFHEMIESSGSGPEANRFITRVVDHVFDGKQVEVRLISYELFFSL